MNMHIMAGFIVLITFSTLTLIILVGYYFRYFHSIEQRKKKAVAVRVPELLQMSLAITTLHIASMSVALFNASQKEKNRTRLTEYGLSLFCAEFFEAMICCLALRMDWQFSLGKLEMARVWKSELNMQVKRAWVLYLTPLLRTAHSLIATCLALAVLLTVMELLTLRTVYLAWSVPMTGLVLIILECTLSTCVICIISFARHHTGKVKDHYGIRSEMKWIIVGLILWSVVGISFLIFLQLESLTWSLAHHCRNTIAIFTYYYLTLYRPCIKYFQLDRSTVHRQRPGIGRSEAVPNIPSASIALLKKVLRDYESFVLLTEHCVSEMSVEGILFIVWYMRAKQLFFVFLRDHGMFDYDSVPDIDRLPSAWARKSGTNLGFFQTVEVQKSSSPSGRKSRRNRAMKKSRRRTSLTLSIPSPNKDESLSPNDKHPRSIRDEDGQDRPIVLQDFFAFSKSQPRTLVRRNVDNKEDSNENRMIRMPSFISQSLHISARKKPKMRKASTLPNNKSDPPQKLPVSMKSRSTRLSMPRFSPISPIPEALGASFIKISASMSPLTSARKAAKQGDHMELITLTRSSPEVSSSHSRRPLHLRIKRRALSPADLLTADGIAGSLGETAMSVGDQSSRENDSASPPLVVTPRFQESKDKEETDGIKDRTIIVGRDDSSVDPPNEMSQEYSQTENDDTQTEVIITTEDDELKFSEAMIRHPIHDHLNSDTIDNLTMTGSRDMSKFIEDIRGERLKSDTSLQLVIDMNDEDDSKLTTVIPLSHVSKVGTFSMDSVPSCLSPKELVSPERNPDQPILKSTNESGDTAVTSSVTAVAGMSNYTSMSQTETVGSSKSGVRKTTQNNYSLASLSLIDLRQPSLISGTRPLSLTNNVSNGSPPSKTKLKIFQEIGEVIPLPLKVLGKDFIHKNQNPHMKITKNHYLSPSVSPPLERDNDNDNDNGIQPPAKAGYATNTHYLFTPSVSSGAVSPTVTAMNELSYIVNILIFILDKFVSMDGLHSMNISNDSRKSAMKYRQRLYVISDSKKGDSVMEKIALTLSLDKRVKLILRCLLCCDGVLKEVLRMVKNDTFYRFHQSNEFHRWYQQRAAQYHQSSQTM